MIDAIIPISNSKESHETSVRYGCIKVPLFKDERINLYINLTQSYLMLNETLKHVKPSKQEEKEVNEKTREIILELNKLKLNAVLGGSVAKGTWLRGNHDFDIFIKFKKGKDISKKVEKKLKKKFKVIKVHGSRDYFRIKRDNFTFEIVPILDIRKASEAENITDVSPLHTKWVQKHKKYIDEIRLAKAFARAQKVYGAESYIRGFSGYVLEILLRVQLNGKIRLCLMLKGCLKNP